ncbi:hypothetical protein AB0K89_16560 [Streptomyces cinnamoneus]|uniref:hypothetical protein n=1 Tax=Streptomyces cinnamoneus TaxID=53446 RepID=UPI003420252E
MDRREAPERRRRLGPAGWLLAAVLGGVWCWAVFRLIAQPGRTGFLEGVVATGGWGLSLLPVHCVPRDRKAGGRDGEGAAGGEGGGSGSRRWWRRTGGPGSG